MPRLTDGTAAATARSGDRGRRFSDTDVRLRPELIRIAVRYAQRYGGEWDYMLSAQELALRDNDLPPGVARAVLNCLRTDPLAILEDPELAHWLLSDPAVVQGALADAVPDFSQPPGVSNYRAEQSDPEEEYDEPEGFNRRSASYPVRVKVRFGIARRGEVTHIVRDATAYWYPDWDGWGWARDPVVRVSWQCAGKTTDPILVAEPDLTEHRPCRQCFVQAGVEAMISGG